MERFADIYIHLPFCALKCDYCAFYSLGQAPPELRTRFLARLEQELAAAAPRCGPLRTVYFGGGTPSYFPLPELRRLLAAVTTHLQLGPATEFTCECNPITVTREKLELLLAHGVTRFSLGVQSFSPATRERIGRHGRIEHIFPAVANLREAGCSNYNCDLIYAVPGQSLSDWQTDLTKVLELAPAHVSAYSLMVEPGTPLAAAGTKERDDDDSIAMWQLGGDQLAAAGLQRYEISNYARPGHECQHNLRVWRGTPFFGLGPSACWYDGRQRWTNAADLESWFAGEAATPDPLARETRAAEILVTGLRTVAGWQRTEFEAITGIDYLRQWEAKLAELAAADLVRLAGDRLCLTPRGMMLANYVARELM